jgi:hypothetical protein
VHQGHGGGGKEAVRPKWSVVHKKVTTDRGGKIFRSVQSGRSSVQ